MMERGQWEREINEKKDDRAGKKVNVFEFKACP